MRMLRVSLLAAFAAVSGVIAFPTQDSQIAFKAPQGEPVSVLPALEQIGDDVTRWAQDGRDFVRCNGTTCESSDRLL